jgi:hypothetical protein
LEVTMKLIESLTQCLIDTHLLTVLTRVCVECLFSRSPGQALYRANSVTVTVLVFGYIDQAS